MPAKSPVDITDATLAVVVEVNGNPIQDIYPVLSIQVHHEVNKISYAEIVLADGNITDSSFPISDGNSFIPGNPIEIKAGYGDDARTSIFKGVIVKQGIRINGTSINSVVVTCKHKAVEMTFNKKEAAFSQSTDSSIIQTVVGTYGISVTVDSTSVTQETIFQKMATDWDFILARAELYGYIITLSGDDMTVGKPNVSASAVLRVATGESIRSFNATIDAELQVPSLKTSAWDIKNQALLTASASEPSVNSQGNLNGKALSSKLSQQALTLNACVPMLQDELKAWADGSLLRLRLSAVKGDVSFIGNASVAPGNIIELDGVGERFNGSAFVTAVEHTIEDGEWTTRTIFGLDNIAAADKPNFSYPLASGLLPAIHGLQIGTVKKITEDPDGQFRVLISLASNAENQDGIWARMAGFYASSGNGAYFMPETGDEVVVGFLESNPRYPVILGSLYSNARQSPYTPDDKNTNKAIITKSKLKIIFDDDKKITTIITPGNNSITLSDDAKSIEIVDQNNNSVKMTSSGIALKSAKDITLDATGDIKLTATGKVNVSATQDVVVSGMNINQTANMGFTAKGNATAEVSASGQTTLKGGIVMIN